MCHVGRLPTQVGEEVLVHFVIVKMGLLCGKRWQQEPKHRRPEEAAAETQSRKALGKSWPDFVELVHGCELHSCAK